MHRSVRLSTRNRLLAALSLDDFALLEPDLEQVTLKVRDVLVVPNEPIEHVYFLEGGLSSTAAAGGHAEIGMVGPEGLADVAVVLGVDRSPHETVVQIGGKALRIGVRPLCDAIGQSASLRLLLLNYAQVVLVQTGQTAHANARYVIEERLARWILMCADRLDGDDVPLTHDFFALMLGVRRPGITNALHVLEGEHMIKATRGHVRVLDRSKLQQLAGASYGVPEAEYERLIGSGCAPHRPGSCSGGS